MFAMASRPICPGDAVTVAVLVAEMLRRGADADWSVKAGSLEWDVERTVVHILGSLAKHTLYLASRTSRYIAWSVQKFPGATHADLIHSVEWCGRALANVAAETPPDVRAFHTLGMADAEGYVALDCFHMLEHAHDVALGLELYFDAPSEICEAVLARHYPWLPIDAAPWSTLLWVAGRTVIPGQDPFDQFIGPVLAPLAEWDGSIPRHPPKPPTEWVFEREQRRWRPVAAY